MDYEGTVIVVSHDRHFLNMVCTHIVDIDFKKIKIYTGNYDFWYESSQLMQKLMRGQNRKKEDKIKELQSFISRFSANKSKAKQATARRKLLDKLTVEELPVSSRKYPYLGFEMDREPGKEILTVENLSKTVDGVKVLNNVSFRIEKSEKVAFVVKMRLQRQRCFRFSWVKWSRMKEVSNGVSAPVSPISHMITVPILMAASCLFCAGWSNIRRKTIPKLICEDF